MVSKRTASRYEKKYLVENSDLTDIRSFVSSHPAGFYQAHPQRRVNSLYFDSPTLKFYQASLDGDYHRIKPRFRWYQTEAKQIKTGQLEFKIKNGELGYKKVVPIKKICFDIEEIGKQAPIEMATFLETLVPTLLTSYTREYYLSADQKVRLTIDSDLKYTDYFYQTGYSLNDPRTVVEIKYQPGQEIRAQAVVQDLPLVLSKMSKYAVGVETLAQVIY